MDYWSDRIEQSKTDYLLKRLQEMQNIWAARTMNTTTTTTTDAAVVWPPVKRQSDEPLVSEGVASYLAEWFAR